MIAMRALSGCEQATLPATNEGAPANVTAPAAPMPPAAEERSVFTSLENCRVIEQTDGEGGWMRQRCSGKAGVALEVTEGDLRQNLLLVRAGGEKDNLGLPSMAGGGGFSSLGKTAEWRAAVADGSPRTLTVRFDVVENPDQPERPTSYLLVTRLEAPACVVAAVPPGPKQSARARAIADAAALPACLPKPA